MQEAPRVPQEGRGRRAGRQGPPEAPPAEGGLRELFQEPAALAALAVAALGWLVLGPGGTKPAWTKDLPPLSYRTAGAWRGRGSFGSAPFGPQTGHRR